MEICYDVPSEEYHKLYAHKAEIEEGMGVTYEWKEMPEKKSRIISEEESQALSSRLAKYLTGYHTEIKPTASTVTKIMMMSSGWTLTG